jgi:hypothetical protein
MSKLAVLENYQNYKTDGRRKGGMGGGGLLEYKRMFSGYQREDIGLL